MDAHKRLLPARSRSFAPASRSRTEGRSAKAGRQLAAPGELVVSECPPDGGVHRPGVDRVRMALGLDLEALFGEAFLPRRQQPGIERQAAGHRHRALTHIGRADQLDRTGRHRQVDALEDIGDRYLAPDHVDDVGLGEDGADAVIDAPVPAWIELMGGTAPGKSRYLVSAGIAVAVAMASRNGAAKSFSLAAPTPLTSANSVAFRGRRRAMSASDLSEKTT